jgi:hypothetical protein
MRLFFFAILVLKKHPRFFAILCVFLVCAMTRMDKRLKINALHKEFVGYCQKLHRVRKHPVRHGTTMPTEPTDQFLVPVNEAKYFKSFRCFDCGSRTEEPHWLTFSNCKYLQTPVCKACHAAFSQQAVS